MPQPALYDAILARRSVRRFDPTPLDELQRLRVEEIVAEVKPLVPENPFSAPLVDVVPDGAVLASMGAYGRILQPPHCLVPHIPHGRHVLVDLGFRVEQIAVRLVMLGIGSCYVGVLKDEAAAVKTFGLPLGTRIGALLAVGRPAPGLAANLLGQLVRTAVGATNKLPAERIFFWERFDEPGSPQGELAPLVEAARHAPSADNAQPWRLLKRETIIYLFVRRFNRRYGPGHRQHYRFYDGGICMANISMAMEAWDMSGRWTLLEGTEEDIPAHPEELQPLARLDLR